MTKERTNQVTSLEDITGNQDAKWKSRPQVRELCDKRVSEMAPCVMLGTMHFREIIFIIGVLHNS